MKSKSLVLLLGGFLIHIIPNYAATQGSLLSTPPDANVSLNHPKPMGSDSENSEQRIQDVLNFWFGLLSSPTSYPEAKTDLWFKDSSDSGRQIGSLFEEDVHRALLGQLNHWRSTPKGRLALIILLDQFPRYIYPEKPQAFASEGMAKGLVLEGIQKGDDKKLFPAESNCHQAHAL